LEYTKCVLACIPPEGPPLLANFDKNAQGNARALLNPHKIFLIINNYSMATNKFTTGKKVAKKLHFIVNNRFFILCLTQIPRGNRND
jgi:hypothetical protein